MSEHELLDELTAIGEQIVAGVERELPGWAEREVARILDAWNRLDEATNADAFQRGYASGVQATDRIGRELRALFSQDPAQQAATPLQVVRTAYREPTVVLQELGVAPVVRDPFDVRANPEDFYGLAPKSLADLGDADLGPKLLAWGMAKARVMRIRPASGGEPQ